jgi:hypothetical protein
VSSRTNLSSLCCWSAIDVFVLFRLLFHHPFNECVLCHPIAVLVVGTHNILPGYPVSTSQCVMHTSCSSTQPRGIAPAACHTSDPDGHTCCTAACRHRHASIRCRSRLSLSSSPIFNTFICSSQVSIHSLPGRLPPFDTLPHPSCRTAVDVVSIRLYVIAYGQGWVI